MNETMNIITKDSLKAEFESMKRAGGVYAADPVVLAETRLGKKIGSLDQKNAFDIAFSAPVTHQGAIPKMTGKYGTVLAAPFPWSDGRNESVLDRVRRGAFGSASSNSLIPDWQQLWEIMRIDLTMRKTANPTLRQFIYNILSRPDADKSGKIVDVLPWFVKFEKINANGQPLPMGYRGGFLTDNYDIEVYGAAFVWTLLAALFDKSLDMTQLNDAVAVGYNSKLDDLAFSPILAYNYSTAGTAKHTAANSTGAEKFEKLYLTLEKAVEDLGVRSHPVIATEKIQANELIYLGSTNSARHVAKVAGGLPVTTTINRPYPQIAEISQILGYDGMSTHGYSGVGDTYGYLIKKNEFMNVIVKRGLTAEIDPQPDVKTLAQEERAWWFAEGLYHGGDYGIGSFIQKITLPAW